MGMDRFHIDGEQVFLLLTGWFKHSVATLLSAPNGSDADSLARKG